jgi:hypothetical protein
MMRAYIYIYADLLSGSQFTENYLKEQKIVGLEEEDDAGQAGGGAVCFEKVKQAYVRGSTFTANVAVPAASHGGAMSSLGSSVTLESVDFLRNAALKGSGGALSVQGGDVEFLNASSVKGGSCVRAEIVVDYTTTLEHCGQYFDSNAEVCDNLPGSCGPLSESPNPYAPEDKKNIAICAGCACPWSVSTTQESLLRDYSLKDLTPLTSPQQAHNRFTCELTFTLTSSQDLTFNKLVSSRSPAHAHIRGTLTLASAHAHIDTLTLTHAYIYIYNRDFQKYFLLSTADDDSEANIAFYSEIKDRLDPRANGYADSAYSYSVACLEAGMNYSIAAYDDLGEGWWGASLSVHIIRGDQHLLTVHEVPAWSGTQSPKLHFHVDDAYNKEEKKDSRMSGNAALNGGGGAFFWQSERETLGEPRGLDDGVLFDENRALYGNDLATEPTRLVVEMDDQNDHLTTVLVDAYGTVVTSAVTVVLTSVPAANRVLHGGIAHFPEFNTEASSLTSTEVVVFSAVTMGLSTAPTAVRCHPGYRPDDVATCAPCADDEYWVEGACKSCVEGMRCGTKTVLEERILANVGAERGWWRKDATAWKFRRCPYSRACKKGAVFGKSVCRDGHEGPACSSCSDQTHYYKASALSSHNL